jgi:hypothetical protein
MGRGDVFRLGQQISKDIKDNPENYHTGLIGEAVIISAWKKMSILDLEKLIYIAQKIVKKKKEMERVRLNAGVLDHLVRDGMADDQQKSN